MNKNNRNLDVLVIAFALFSMFFGAGNLIFPSYIGMNSGSQWIISFLGFIIADVGIILLSIYATLKAGSYQQVVGRAGRRFGLTLEIIMMLCLGPILVIPRTGATTYEMSISPLFENFSPFVFSVLFFIVVFLLTIRPTKVIDIIGKFLTPVLLISLSVLIIKGIVSPLGDLSSDLNSDDLFVGGLTQGYQTMDALGIGGITALIVSSFVSKGYNDKSENIKLSMKAASIACLGLCIVYGGLAYLGATVSTVYSSDISQTALLVNITNLLLGKFGMILLGIIVLFACLTTAVGLTSVTARYFEEVSNNKLKYKALVTFICIFSALASNLGVDKIIEIAIPILTVIYPVCIALVIMSIFDMIFVSDNMFKGGAYATLFISILNVINSLGFNIDILNTLPFTEIGFNWVLPALVGAFIGKFIK